MPLVDECIGRGGIREVDLVDDDDGGDTQWRIVLEDTGCAVRLLDGIGDVEDDVGIGGVRRRRTSSSIPGACRRVSGCRGIGVDDLEIVTGDDPHDAVAGGLGHLR